MISSAMYDDVATADAMLARLSDLLRHTLCAPPAQEVSLGEELRSLRLYLEILQARFGDRLQVRYAIAEEAMPATVPQLLLQPLAENAIRHGADASSDAVDLEIRAERKDEELWLWVRDRGPGFGTSANSGGHGLGLTNTRERLRSLYGATQEVVCRNRDGGGAEVFLRLPWRAAAVEAAMKVIVE
jgi:LytS/YehU family sensor histidine kinase